MEDTSIFLQQTHHQSNSILYSFDPISLILSQNSSIQELKLVTESFYAFERGPRYRQYAQLRESRIQMKRNFENLLEEEEESFFREDDWEKTSVRKQVRFEGDMVNSYDVENLFEEEDEEKSFLPGNKQMRFRVSMVNSYYAEDPPEKKEQARLRGNTVNSHLVERSPKKKPRASFRGSMVNSNKAGYSPDKMERRKFGGSTVNPLSGTSSYLARSVPDFSAMIRKENRRPANANALPRPVDLTPPPSKSYLGKNGGVLMSSGSRGSKSASAGEKKKEMGAARKSYGSVEDLKKISMAAASAINGEGGKRAGGGRTVLRTRQY